MESMYINHLAVIAAAISNMIVGAIWYSPALFYEAWKQEAGVTDAAIESAKPAKMYGFAFLAALIIAYNLAAFLGDSSTTAAWGAAAGFLAGFGFSAMAIWAISLFEQRSTKYFLINGGYVTVVFTVMGFIIGIWR